MPRHDNLPRFHDNFLRRCRLELLGFYRVFRFHDNNNHIRKAVTLAVVAVWAVLELAIAIDNARIPESMTWMRLFVGLLLARMWNIELTNFTGATINGRREDDGDGNGDGG